MFTIVFALTGVSVILYALSIIGREYVEQQSKRIKIISRKVRHIHKKRKKLSEERKRKRDYSNSKYGY
jgi:sulfite exporter TauE/SafE